MFFSALTRGRNKSNTSKKMIINVVHPEESRVAIIENGLLQELAIESTSREKIRGNIYKGVVQKVEESLYAAFVEYGGNRPGFLPLGEVRPAYYSAKPHANGKTPAHKVLKKNQEIIVQVTKDEKGTKGAALTTYTSLPGRYLVLMPGYHRTGISKKIEDSSERQKLKDIGRQLKLPESMGFIIRTAGLNKTKKELQSDANYLLRLLKAIEARAKECQGPRLIYQESNMVIQSIRDYFTTDISEVIIDNAEVQRKAREFFKQIMPKHQKKVKLYEEPTPLFVTYNIEPQISPLYERRVFLKSGGSISIDPTEALVSIDVNTARFTRARDPEESALLTNVEAAREVARQLRLRDLGGLIVIDFIDMRNPKNRQQVEKELKNAFKGDKANVEFSKISKFGLLEMCREHLRSPLIDTSHVECPYCSGTGKYRSKEALSLAIIRELHAKASLGAIAEIKISLCPEAAQHLLNTMRSELYRLEQHYGLSITVTGHATMPVDHYSIDYTEKKQQ